MEKAYRLGILVGRFQILHNGHRYMIGKAIELCDRVDIFVGSSQESGTNKNPFSYEKREAFLRRVFGDRVEIYPLPDIGVGNNSKWGDYVLENVKQRFGEYPDILISGKEERRVEWFDRKDLAISELYVPKMIDISATQMREMLAENDFENWKRYADERLWNDFPFMRDVILATKGNLKTSSM